MQFSAFSLIIIYFFLRIGNKNGENFLYTRKEISCDPDMSFKAYILYITYTLV